MESLGRQRTTFGLRTGSLTSPLQQGTPRWNQLSPNGFCGHLKRGLEADGNRNVNGVFHRAQGLQWNRQVQWEYLRKVPLYGLLTGVMTTVVEADLKLVVVNPSHLPFQRAVLRRLRHLREIPLVHLLLPQTSVMALFFRILRQSKRGIPGYPQIPILSSPICLPGDRNCILTLLNGFSKCHFLNLLINWDMGMYWALLVRFICICPSLRIFSPSLFVCAYALSCSYTFLPISSQGRFFLSTFLLLQLKMTNSNSLIRITCFLKASALAADGDEACHSRKKA